ncbi:tRNA (adenosine(37)-N6)-threonylcarbamoyltransferase complex dimerization subunit type 1 TsaB [candidate division KSB1 bacterium]|nr:tRNA (adenosine(37)-N6)-threonylcarbamoyltransferase complex dimerization subunit type 1 TsaB [candidate division KSB1 bacterium]
MKNDHFYILGVDTATRVCGVALSDGPELVAESRLNLKNVHQRKIIGMIDRLLKESEITLKDLSGMAISIGPGSFTGLRIGLAVIKGLLLTHSVPLAAVPTLEALAAQARIKEGLICPLLRARTDTVYAALYERKQNKDTLVKAPEVMPVQALTQFIPGSAYLTGDLCALEIKFVHFNTLAKTLASAYTIARLGYYRIQNRQTVDGRIIEPAYYQDFKPGRAKKQNQRM